MVSEGREVCITVRVTVIRDGTQGVSLSMPDNLIGEWTDSSAVSLMITDEYRIGICDITGESRYYLSLPGTPFKYEQISKTEASVYTVM